jgi:orotidine-5'-phosphate decarboxylase
MGNEAGAAAAPARRPGSPRDRVVLAFDRLDLAAARPLLRRLASRVGAVKVGLELYTAAGPAAVEAAREAGGRVFLDLKLHDIPNTVEGAARAAARLGVDFLTVHAAGGPAMLAAALAGAAAGASGRPGPTLLAVTVLTSLDEAALAAVGLAGPPGVAALRLARLAVAAGVPGLVCSPQEVADFRQALGAAPLIVTPGIRATAAGDDQRRTLAAAAALRAGSDYVVVGRPVLADPDPEGALERLVEELAAAEDAAGR